MTSAEHAPTVVAQSVLDDLRGRLHACRRVDVPTGFGWACGVDGDYLANLITYWADAYNWREHETRLLGLPWDLIGDDNTPMRAVHQRAADAEAVAVVLLHGWPDSILRFEKVLPLLSDLHVIVPALPGFPFAAPIARHAMSSSDMEEVVANAMSKLGYERYVVSAGDVGCDVAEALAAHHPDRGRGPAPDRRIPVPLPGETSAGFV